MKDQTQNIPLKINQLHFTGIHVKYYSSAKQLCNYEKDIIEGIYEGGFQLWECQTQLLSRLDCFPINGKRVLEIGCGHGLLGIAALRMGAAHVCFQDYNKEVLSKVTIPTINLNALGLQGVSFLNGDWEKLECNGERYDFLLGSELIYNPDSYSKLCLFIRNFMMKQGKCLLINKCYYFGVGGSISAFQDALEKYQLHYRTLEKIQRQSGGNKKSIIEITF